MQLNRTKNELDREARNNENQNWEKIEKIADDISGKAFDQLVDKAKLIWKEPVNTFEDLPSNAEIGETRQIRSTGKVYRWDGTDWNEIQQIDAGPVNEVDTRLTNKITTVQNEIENASVSHTGTNYNNLKERLDKEHQEVTAQLAQVSRKEIDFVRLLREHNEVPNSLYTRIIGERYFEVVQPIRGNIVARHIFRKNTNDDYIKYHTISIGETKNESGKNFDSKTGTWNTTTPPNYFTTEVGATFTVTFRGTGIDFQHYADNRGGVWEFNLNNGEKIVQYSTYQSTAGDKRVNIFKNLEAGEHTVVATFLGADPNNPPSDGTARGWVGYDLYGNRPEKKTVVVLDSVQATDIFMISPNSNKEFALNVRPNGLSAVWIPEHNNTPTTFAVEQMVFFDGKEITDWTSEHFGNVAKNVKIIQKMVAKHPDNPDSPMAELITIHTINVLGVTVNVKINFLQPLSISSGYGPMLPADGRFATELITSLNNVYDATLTDYNETTLNENDRATSFAFVSQKTENNKNNFVLAMTILNPEKTLRYHQTDRRSEGVVWLQGRDIQKLYTEVYDSTTVNAGDSYEGSVSFYVGELPMAYGLLV